MYYLPMTLNLSQKKGCSSTAQQAYIEWWKGSLFTTQANWIALAFLRWTHLLPVSSFAKCGADGHKHRFLRITENQNIESFFLRMSNDFSKRNVFLTSSHIPLNWCEFFCMRKKSEKFFNRVGSNWTKW